MKKVLEALATLLPEVSAREILPRFQRLAQSDIISKASATDPDDLVTIADRAAEAYLTPRLATLVPGSRVVGEEAASQTASVLDELDGEAPVWVVDPIDGTKNFAAGVGPFGVMVALIDRGVTQLSAIYLPLTQDLYLAERDAGATWNGQELVARPNHSAELVGTLYTRLMPAPVLASLNARPESLRLSKSPQCAAVEYTDLARGERDFALFYRLFPWDHAPGALIVREASGVAAHPGGGEYGVRDRRPLLLVASDSARWQRVRRALFDVPRATET